MPVVREKRGVNTREKRLHGTMDESPRKPERPQVGSH